MATTCLAEAAVLGVRAGAGAGAGEGAGAGAGAGGGLAVGLSSVVASERGEGSLMFGGGVGGRVVVI